MKKILCLVVALMLLSCAAMAESEKEITFQGVKWGSNWQVTAQALIDNDYIPERYEWAVAASKPGSNSIGSGVVSSCPYLAMEDGGSIALKNNDYFSSFSIGITYSVNDDKQIAGYILKNVYANFAYDQSKEELLAVIQRLRVENTDEAFKDLTTKLTNLYGEYSQFEAAKASLTNINFNYEGTYHAWQGANNTAVVLVVAKTLKHSTLIVAEPEYEYCIDLIYGTLGAQKMIDAYAANQAQDMMTLPVIDITNYSGL